MIRCFNHGKMSSMVCNHKGCTHRTLCSDCIVTHPKNHVASILPLRDFDPNSYTVPRTIAKVQLQSNQDLSMVRQRMNMLQNHLIQTRETRKAEVRKLQKTLIMYFTDELESKKYNQPDFLKGVHQKIDLFYNEKHIKVAEVIQNCEDHLNKLNSIINGEVDDSRKFDFLLELQDKLVSTIVPTLTQQAEEYSRLSMCSDIIVSPHLERVIDVALEKVFNIDNVLIQEKKPITIENDMYDSLTMFKEQQTQKNYDYYKKQLVPYFGGEKTYVVPQRVQKEDVQLNAIPFEVFVSQQKHLNTLIQGHFDIITTICMLSLGQIASGGGDGIIKFWDIDSQLCLGNIEAHSGGVWCLAAIFEQEVAQQIISGGHDKLLHVWNVKYMTLDFTLIGHLDTVRSVIYAKKFEFIISGGADYRVKVWNRDKCVYTIEDAHKNIIKSIIVIDEQDQYVTAGDSTIKIWQTYKGNLKMELSHGADVFCLKFIPEFKLASGGSDKAIVIWDIRGGFKLQRLQAHHDIVLGLEYFKYLLSVSADKTLRLWDQEGKLIKSVKIHSEQISCILCINLREIIITGGWDKKIRVLSIDYILKK